MGQLLKTNLIFWRRIMGPFVSLFKGIVRKTGSEAVEKAIEDFESIIQDLDEALVEAKEEYREAQAVVERAVEERQRIEIVQAKGQNFLGGLRTLLEG